MQNDTTPKPKVFKPGVKLMLVRYGRMNLMGWFEHSETQIPKRNAKVIVKTDRGLELGEVVGVHQYRSGQFRLTPEQVEAYYGNLGDQSPIATVGAFVRFATHDDLREQEHLHKSEQEERLTCEKYVQQLNLPMRIVDVEHLFGGERIIFYFTSESRVDFRELVKLLAREYQTRIELRQIGARDEAKLVSDYETCGQQCCCSRYLKILQPVNMRMAKLQKATLDPSKISGHCGRLKCCLRYEDQTYQELKENLPPKNTLVRTPKGLGKVVDVQILTQLVIVQNDLGDRQAWPVSEVQVVDAAQAAALAATASADSATEADTEPAEPLDMADAADLSSAEPPQQPEPAIADEELLEVAEELFSDDVSDDQLPAAEQPAQPDAPNAPAREGKRRRKKRRRPKRPEQREQNRDHSSKGDLDQ